jgi:hypothetical protein
VNGGAAAAAAAAARAKAIKASGAIVRVHPEDFQKLLIKSPEALEAGPPFQINSPWGAVGMPAQARTAILEACVRTYR